MTNSPMHGLWRGTFMIPIAIQVPTQGTTYERGICVLERGRHRTGAVHFPRWTPSRLIAAGYIREVVRYFGALGALHW